MSNFDLQDQFNYWQHMINTRASVLEGSFLDGPIDSHSVFVYVMVMNQNKQILRSGWSVHRDVRSVIGYMECVILPACYYTLMDQESDGFFIPMSPFEIVETEVMKLLDRDDQALVARNNYFKRLYRKFVNLYVDQGESQSKKLDQIIDQINNDWSRYDDEMIYLKCFSSTQTIFNYLSSEAFCEFEDLLEEEINMTLGDFGKFCSSVYSQPFINKSFINRLNNQIPYLK